MKAKLRRVVTASLAVAAAPALLVAQAGSAHASTTIALWHTGDSGSTMSDSTGNGHTGYLTNVSTGQTGYSGHAFGFFGHPSYVRVPNKSDLNPGTSSYYKISMRVRFPDRPSSSVGDYDLLRKGLGSTAGGSFKAEILGDGRAYCNFRGSKEVTVTGGPDLSDNAWHSITCARYSTSVKLTVDGQSYSKSGSTGSISNTESMYLGAKDGGGDDQYDGLLDEVSISK